MKTGHLPLGKGCSPPRLNCPIYFKHEYTKKVLRRTKPRRWCNGCSRSSAVYCEFEPRSGQTKDYEIGICWFSTKHAILRRMSKDWLALNQNTVFKWADMSIRELLLHYKYRTKSIGLVQRGSHNHLIKNYLVLAMI